MRTLTRPGTYRPPRGGEPSRLREDGHWSTRDLVGYWPMREGRGSVVQDVSPYGNHGTLTNMDPATDWVAGPDGAALDFDGVDDYVDIPDRTIPLTSDFTITVRLLTSDSAKYQHIIQSYQINQNGRFTHNIYEGNVQAFVGQASNILISSPIISNRWYSTAVRRSGNTLSLYVDAVFISSGTMTTNIYGADQAIGDAPLVVTPNQHLLGQIQSASIYQRALSAAEIAALYAEPYLPLWQPGERSYWYFSSAAGVPWPVLMSGQVRSL